MEFIVLNRTDNMNKMKETYEAPAMKVLNLLQQGIICVSGDSIGASRKSYGSAETQTWEDE